MAFLLFLGGVVAQGQEASTGDPCLKQHQCAMCVDRQCVGFFVKGFALCVDSIESNADLHQDALAAAPGSCVRWNAGKLGHDQLSSFDYTARIREAEANAGKG